MESFLDTATSFVTSWSSWTLSVVVAFGDWLQSLNPAIGAAIGAVSMFAFVWIAVQSFTWLKFMVSMERLPGPLALPWLGNTWQLLGLLDPPRAWLHKKDKKSHLAAKRYRENLVFVKWARRFLPLFRVWVGPVPAVVITDPSVARQILGPTGPLTKSSIYKLIHPWLKTGLLTSTGPKWKARRRLITPSFHFEALTVFFDTFVKQADILAKCLHVASRKGPDGIHVYRYITNATLDIISQCAFGQDVHAQSPDGEQQPAYVQAVNEQTELIFDRVLKPWLYSNRIYYNLTPSGRRAKQALKVLHSYTRSVINKRKADMAAGKVPASPSNFLDTLLLARDTNGDKLSDDAVQEEVDTFMFEGHDTTASGITWAMYYIGCLPDIQRRLHQEVDSAMGDAAHPTMDNIKAMPLLDAVLKESLRLSPPVPYLGRSVQKDMMIGKHRIPAGAQVMVCPIVLHYHMDTFANGWDFIPERFMDGFGFDGKPLPSASKASGTTRQRRARGDSNAATRPEPYAFLAFSAGSRGCVGRRFAELEEKVVLATLLRKFTWEVVEDQDVFIEIGIIMRPKDGKLKIKLTPRTPAGGQP